MSEWTDLEPQAKAAPPTALVRFGLTKMRGARARGVVLIRKAVLAQLGMTHWRVSIREGKGGRAHQIAIVPNTEGRFELSEMGTAKGGGVYRVILPVIDRFPDAALPNEERPFKIETEAKTKILVIDLPPCCWDPARKTQFLQRAAARAGAKA